jgi:hypothetical protein
MPYFKIKTLNYFLYTVIFEIEINKNKIVGFMNTLNCFNFCLIFYENVALFNISGIT